MTLKPEMYISIDIETDGPCPGMNSMLSLGAVAYLEGEEVSCFEHNMYPLEDGQEDSDTMAWWDTQPEAWDHVTSNQMDPINAIEEFATWLEFLSLDDSCHLVACAWPASFDFGFVNWYMHQYHGENLLGFSCLDIRSYANGLFGNPGYMNTRATVPEGDLYKFFGIDTEKYRKHFAVDDARKQGDLLMKLIEYARIQEGPRHNA